MKFMLEAEWYIVMNDGSPLDDTTAPVNLWPYFSFQNVKLEMGTGLTNTEANFNTPLRT